MAGEGGHSLIDALCMPGAEDIDFEPPKLNDDWGFKPVDFS